MKVAICVVACAVAAGCSGSPTRPTDAAGAGTGRLSRTRFMAFGDSLTVGEIPDPSTPYPIILQTELRSRFLSQANDIVVINAGAGGERLLNGVLRFEDAFAAHRPEAVLLMEGVNDLLSLGPDISTTLLQFDGATRDVAQRAGVPRIDAADASRRQVVAAGTESAAVQ